MDLETEGYLHTYDAVNYAIIAVIVVGLPFMVVALCKIYVDHQHSEGKEQEYWEKMQAYQSATSGLEAKLRHEAIAARKDCETQRMKQEENEQELRVLRQRHKIEIKKQETKYQQTLEARMRDIERQKQEVLKKEERSSRECITQLERDVDFWKRRAENFESDLKENSQKLLDEANIYRELRAKYDRELEEKEDTIAELEKDYQHKLDEAKQRYKDLQKKLKELKQKQWTSNDVGPIVRTAIRFCTFVTYSSSRSKKPTNEHESSDSMQ